MTKQDRRKRNQNQNIVPARNRNAKKILQRQQRAKHPEVHPRASIFEFRNRLRSLASIRSAGWFQTLATRLSFFITRGRDEEDFDFSRLGVGEYRAIEDKIYTANTIIKPIGIVTVGNALIRGYVQDIREELNKMAVYYNDETGSDVKVAFNEYTIDQYANIHFSTDKKLQRDYDNQIQDESADDSVLMTYEWLADMDADEQESLWNTKNAFEFVFYNDVPERLAEFYQRAMDWWDGYSKKMKITWSNMHLTVQEYQRYFSTLGFQDTKSIVSKDEIVGTNVRSPNQIFASTDNLIEGNTSDPDGIIVGVNLNSSQVYAINFARESYPVITLFSQLTGTGKTFLIQMIIDGMLLQSDLYEPVVIDRKNEYADFASTSGLRLISFSTESGEYIDTTEIPEPIGETNYDRRIATLARENTKSVFKALLKNIWSADTELALDFVIEELYTDVGYRKQDPQTYRLTRGLSYYSIYTNIDRVIANNPTQAEAIAPLDTYRAIRNQLRSYFEEGGVASDMFRHKLTLEDLSNSTGIVFALDPMATDVESNDIAEELSLLFVSFYVAERQLRSHKRQIMLFVEEAQELLKIDSFANKISALATMGRSSGIKMFMITNAPGIFFGTLQRIKDDNTNTVREGVDLSQVSSAADAIASNIGAGFIGPNSPDNMAQLKKRFSSNDTTDMYLDMLANQTTQPTQALEHKIYISDGQTHTMVDVVADQLLVDMDAYGTRTKFNQKERKFSVKELQKQALSSTKQYSTEFSKRKFNLNDIFQQRGENNAHSNSNDGMGKNSQD